MGSDEVLELAAKLLVIRFQPALRLNDPPGRRDTGIELSVDEGGKLRLRPIEQGADVEVFDDSGQRIRHEEVHADSYESLADAVEGVAQRAQVLPSRLGR